MPESILAMQKIEELRSQGIPCYYTMDAGPNVKVICEKQNVAFIIDELSKFFAKKIFWSQTPDPEQDLSDFSMVPAESGGLFNY